jgi:hypothetical protein
MSKLFAPQELRFRFPGTTYSTTFTAANDATWASGGGSPATIKARFINGPIDVSGLSHERIANPETRTRGRGRNMGIQDRDKGSFSVEFFLNTTLASTELLSLLEIAMGGIATPTTEHAAAGGGTHTTSKIFIDSVATYGVAAGQAALVGVRGDGRGNGEVIPIVTVAADGANPDYIELARTTTTAVADDDVIWFSHTLYPDLDATPKYVDVLMIGDDATSVDQINCVACAITGVEFGQTNLPDGEMPTVKLTFTPGRWRHEPAATKATISHTAGVGANPVGWANGGMWIAPVFSTAQTRGYLLGGKWECNPDIQRQPLLDPAGYSGIGGWRMTPGTATWKFIAYGNEGSTVPLPTYSTDYLDDADTGYQVMRQFGSAADACFAFAFDKTFLDREPYRTELNGCLAYSFEGHGEERATTTDLIAADFKAHFFHS